MKILFISEQEAKISSGMSWSVPARVKAQSKIDDVLWINLQDEYLLHWSEIDVFHTIGEYSKLDLKCLPEEFSRPDVVVFEGFYYMSHVKFAKQLKGANIPYVIVPRCSLTNQALHNHAWLKKWIAHKLFFNNYIRGAWKIQYLTQQEADDSVANFKTPYIIIPNGFDTPKESKREFSNGCVHATFIGRLDIYQKGLDILLDALTDLHDDLRQVKFTLSIFGPQNLDCHKIEKEISKRKIDDIVFLYNAIGGEDKKKALLDTDIFVLTSRFEGHPMGLIEALAYGLPCLVTPGSNMATEIKEADAGWICEGNVESIKHTILMAIKDRHLYEKKGMNAKNLAKIYDWDKLALDFHNEISSLI